jgi:hypothetical protein
MLDAEEMIVRETVGPGKMFGFDRSLPVPHHHVEDGDRATQCRQGGDKCYRQEAEDRGPWIHQHPIVKRHTGDT